MSFLDMSWLCWVMFSSRLWLTARMCVRLVGLRPVLVVLLILLGGLDRGVLLVLLEAFD
jgi:hypothetical protein